MPSVQSINISTGMSGCRNSTSGSHSSLKHNSYSWYNVSPIIILVDVYIATSENYSV